MTRFYSMARLGQVLIVFSLIAAGQPTAATSAQLAPQPAGNRRPLAAAAPPARSASPAGCQWSYYPISGGHLQAEHLLYNDPDNTPISNLSTGNLFKGKPLVSASLASTGATDFDGDGKTDIFRTTPRLDGNLQWQYSSGGTGVWQDLAFAGPELPAAQLQFGNFDGNSATDVFALSYLFPKYKWQYSPDGIASFQPLHTTGYFADRLALGDFNGDGVTDVFTASTQNITEQWGYFPGISGNPSSLGSVVNLAHSDIGPDLLRFGDFNGDGTTDVFAGALQGDGSTLWEYSLSGVNSFTHLITSTVPYSELQFGDFNGDGTTDVLAALPQNDGGRQVVMWPGGLGPSVTLGHIPAPAPALRVGDFNGDGTSDLLALRCGMGAPLKFGPLQTLATADYRTFTLDLGGGNLAGDVNGDGQPDVILASTCQNPDQFGHCVTNHLQVGAALGTAAHTDTLVPAQELSADDFKNSKILAGDFNGDGQTDLAVMLPTSPTLTITVGLSNGDGTFELSAPQSFGGEDWGSLNPITGDFNGDGKTDLAFTTVCNTVSLNAGGCTPGDSNSVRVALASGGGIFNLGAKYDLGGPTGWNSYYAFAGDFNGDGKTDLLFNSTCQVDINCTGGSSNFVYTALSNGLGNFTLGARQAFGAGWSDFPNSENLVGDVNGDGRSDLVWSSNYQSVAKTNNHLVVVGLANPDGTLALGSTQDYGSAWTGYLTLADFNRDGKADLLWNNAPAGDTDVDTYVTALSNGNGTFRTPQSGAVYTGQGDFQMPTADGLPQLPSQLTLLSTVQYPVEDSISNALFIVNGWLQQSVYLPLVRK